jgi:hypothetical protein
MKTKLFAILLVLSMATIIAENPLSVSLNLGRNNFTIQEDFPIIYASQLIEEHPQIQSITTYQYGQTFGYVNVLGGIGTNFQIEPTKDYEIHTNSSITIYLRA